MKKHRETAEILLDLKAEDRRIARHKAINENGCGFVDFSRQNKLYKELYAAQEAVFLASWTAEITQARLAIWNKEIAKIANKRFAGGTLAAEIKRIEQRLGFEFIDLKKAKELHCF